MSVVFDPRAKLAFFIVANIAVTSSRSLVPTAVAGVVTVCALGASRMWRAIARYGACCAVFAALYAWLPMLVHATWAALLCMAAFWFLRFSVLFGVMAWVFATTSPSELMAALTWAHAPRCILIPLTVVFRFFPVVGNELKAILDAMHLRGIAPGAFDLVAHPIRCSEYIAVPLLASSMRLADDLSASGLLRGLGTLPHPTSAVPLRWRTCDTLLAAGMALVVAAMPLSAIWGG